MWAALLGGARPPEVSALDDAALGQLAAKEVSKVLAAAGEPLRPNDVAIIIPWHGGITVGADMAQAAALQVRLRALAPDELRADEPPEVDCLCHDCIWCVRGHAERSPRQRPAPPLTRGKLVRELGSRPMSAKRGGGPGEAGPPAAPAAGRAAATGWRPTPSSTPAWPTRVRLAK